MSGMLRIILIMVAMSFFHGCNYDEDRARIYARIASLESQNSLSTKEISQKKSEIEREYGTYDYNKLHTKLHSISQKKKETINSLTIDLNRLLKRSQNFKSVSTIIQEFQRTVRNVEIEKEAILAQENEFSKKRRELFFSPLHCNEIIGHMKAININVKMSCGKLINFATDMQLRFDQKFKAVHWTTNEHEDSELFNEDSQFALQAFLEKKEILDEQILRNVSIIFEKHNAWDANNEASSCMSQW